jgi:hypothetical protein
MALSHQLRDALYTYTVYRRLTASLKTRARKLRERGLESSAATTDILAARISETADRLREPVYEAIAADPFMQRARGVRKLNGINVARCFLTVDMDKCLTVASLWQYMGLGVNDGYSTRIAALQGGRRTYSSETFGAIGGVRRGILAKDGPYRPAYEERKVYEFKRGYGGRAANVRAIRYATKLWLKHAYYALRVTHGLPLPQPHPDDITFDPRPFGWRV